MNSSLTTTATLLLVAIATASADCLVGDILHAENEPTGGHLGLECINSTSYDGSAAACGPGGEIINAELVFACPDSVPFCVQCGPRGLGGALCLSRNVTDRVCPTALPQPDTDLIIISTTATTTTAAGMQYYGEEEPFLPPSTPSSNSVLSYPAFDQCDTAADIDVWTSAGGDASRPEHMNYCAREYDDGKGCLVDTECIEQCFREIHGYTEECSACFGVFPGCSLDNGCALTCAADSFSAECEECNAPCIDDFNECSGLPEVTIQTASTPSSTSCSDGREGIDNATCTLALREESCEDAGSNEEQCNALGCCQWDDVAGLDSSSGICSAACIVPEDGEACCNIISSIDGITNPSLPSDQAVTNATSAPLEVGLSDCVDGREGIDDASCTLTLRKDTCEAMVLNEDECSALGCCQWDAINESCSAACIIPDDGSACCLLAEEPIGTSEPTSAQMYSPSTSPSLGEMNSTKTPTSAIDSNSTTYSTILATSPPIEVASPSPTSASPTTRPITTSPTSDPPTISPSAKLVAPPAPDNSRSGENAASSKAGSTMTILALMGLLAIVLV